MKKGIVIGIICLVAVIAIAVCIVLVIKGNDNEKDGSAKNGKNGQTIKETKTETVTCTGKMSGVDIVVTYSINAETKEELVNTMEYTINFPEANVTASSETNICTNYENSGFKNCHVKFADNKAVITVTPATDVYQGKTIDAIKKEYETGGMTCTLS